jgi:hypothetical protein
MTSAAAPAPPLTSFSATHTRSARVLINLCESCLLRPTVADECSGQMGGRGWCPRCLRVRRHLFVLNFRPRAYDARKSPAGRKFAPNSPPIIQHVARVRCCNSATSAPRLRWFNEGSWRMSVKRALKVKERLQINAACQS